MSITWNGAGGYPEPSDEYEGFMPGSDSAMARIGDMDPDGWDIEMPDTESGIAYGEFREKVISQFGAEQMEAYEHQRDDPEMGQ